MIQSFSCPLSQRYFETGRADALAFLEPVLARKLQLLHSTPTLAGLQAPASNQLVMARTSEDKHSMAIDANYRLYFHWSDDGPTHVAIAHVLTPKDATMQDQLPPTHPGEVLREDYLRPLGMTPQALATALHVPVANIEALVNESCALDANMALRLTRYFGGDVRSWLNLQQSYDLKQAVRDMPSNLLATIDPMHSNTTQHTGFPHE